jgi:hypothetical protein
MSKLAKVLQAAAGNAGGGGEYIEDVFSTYLWAGNSTNNRAIVNNIDVSGEGGLVWIKDRTVGDSHSLFTTDRGANKTLLTNTTDAEDTVGTDVFNSFNSDGFTVGSHGRTNENNRNYVSWTWRKSPKFFDVVTFTGTAATQNIAHNLGSVPGMIIVKSTTAAGGWAVWHNSLSSSTNHWLRLDWTNGEINQTDFWPSAPTDSQFTVGGYAANNAENETLVAYLFAHNAGGFGDDAQQNVISCGSYTEGASAQDITLGYEPQWLLMKRTNGASDWYLYDTMRGMGYTDSNALVLNTSDPEAVFGNGFFRPTATGFTALPSYWGSGASVIYIAIRRPMKTPESGTSVFTPDLANAAVAPLWEAPFPVDLGMYAKRDSSTATFYAGTRLTGTGRLSTWDTAAEVTDNGFKWDYMNGWFNNAFTDSQYLGYSFRRAPGFFDVVAYTGTGGATTFAHNLAAVPELMISKNRSQISNWAVYHKDLPLVVSAGPALNLDRAGNLNPYDFGLGSGGYESPTSSVFTVGPNSNSGTDNFVAYLFASCPGVSKVGSYTGTGADLNLDCGFSAGARFVLIKRTDSTGDWYVWDSARGIVAGNDPYLLLNSTAAENTSTDYIDPLASGFTVTSSAPAALNASGGSYIFLAIA